MTDEKDKDEISVLCYWLWVIALCLAWWCIVAAIGMFMLEGGLTL